MTVTVTVTVTVAGEQIHKPADKRCDCYMLRTHRKSPYQSPPPHAVRANEMEVTINDVLIRFDEGIVLSIIGALIIHLY